jgi:3-oxoisoapionate decarboxylase
MKIGLDALTITLITKDPIEILQKIVDYGLEGGQLSSGVLREQSDTYLEEFMAYKRDHGLYLELTGAGINPGKADLSVDELVAGWEPLFPLAERLGADILNTCFGLFPLRMQESPSFSEQYDRTTKVLQRLAPMAADHGVTITVELHVDLTTRELERLIQTVDSPWVRVNLDTANPLGLLEDPIEAARILAPYAVTTHYKDGCVHVTDEGYTWQAGAPLGTGLVDLKEVTRLLYREHPDVHLNYEDGWGSIGIPLWDEAFLASFPELTAVDMMHFLRLLEKGNRVYQVNQHHPRPSSAKTMDGARMMEMRTRHSAAYLRTLREEIVAEEG